MTTMMSRRLRPAVMSHIIIIISNYTHMRIASKLKIKAREKKVKIRSRCHQTFVSKRRVREDGEIKNEALFLTGDHRKRTRIGQTCILHEFIVAENGHGT